MSELITMANGVSVDLHTKYGAFEYVFAFLVANGADGKTCSALGMLCPDKECGCGGHAQGKRFDCQQLNERR